MINQTLETSARSANTPGGHDLRRRLGRRRRRSLRRRCGAAKDLSPADARARGHRRNGLLALRPRPDRRGPRGVDLPAVSGEGSCEFCNVNSQVGAMNIRTRWLR